jgi:competence protein ComEA
MPPALLSSLLARVSLAPRRRLLAALAIPPSLLLAVLVGLLVYGPSHPPAGPPAPGGGDAGAGIALPPPEGLLVDVTGAVAHPGVYRVTKGERVSAAIAAAGGLTTDADPDRLPNLAARLQDGAQVRVPALTTSTARAQPGTPRVEPVSLNNATAEQLASIPGFTAELAAEVIEYRTEYGGFASVGELVDVLQMSEADFQLARRYVTI